ncbi:unnamed protein product [Paramecium primaurelia]|uniref:Mitochondrial carrier protein n=1 Tax=Paramecium primaurelia TaxID=5886 RepID=A0A8S1L504_PARPR|nr:unnamed protein product [Paramecium primaurelia]
MSDFIQWTYENRLQISIDLAAGSVSGIANCISSHPLDTVKVRMQMSNDGVLSTLNKIFKNEGTKGFYKGMSFPILSIPITNAIVFSVYEFWRSFFIGNSNKQLTYFQTAFCGSIAGSSAAFFSCPIELTKCKLQMQSTEKIYKNPIDCIQQIYKKEGFKSLFRGMCATQQREILGYSAQFAVYELIKDFFCGFSQKAEPSTANLLISGGLAGVSCWTIGYPQDTIKTILQCQKPTDQGIYKVRFYDGGFLDCLRKKIISEGIGSIWKGYSVCIFRSFYANAIGFYAYELAKENITSYYQQY